MALWLPENFLSQTTKRSTSPKFSDFQNGKKSPWYPFSYVGSKFKCLQLIYRWKGNFILSNILVRNRVKKWAYLELLTENQGDIFLKVVGFLLKIVKIQKNELRKSQQLFNWKCLLFFFNNVEVCGVISEICYTG